MRGEGEGRERGGRGEVEGGRVRRWREGGGERTGETKRGKEEGERGRKREREGKGGEGGGGKEECEAKRGQ